MTTAIVSKSGSDVVDLTIEQQGSPRTELFLDEPLLDGTMDYVVGCSALAVPMSREPMLTYNPQASLEARIHRRPGRLRHAPIRTEQGPRVRRGLTLYRQFCRERTTVLAIERPSTLTVKPLGKSGR